MPSKDAAHAPGSASMSARARGQCVWHAWWQRQQFLLPPGYGGHEHRWVSIQFGVVGCALCGTVHACQRGGNNVVPCLRVFNEDSSSVCEYTAMVLEQSMLLDHTLDVENYNKNRERLYADGGARHSVREGSYGDNVAQVIKQVDATVHAMLYSDTAARCRAAEILRFKRKVDNALQHYTSKHRGHPLQSDVTRAFEYAVCTVRAVRAPRPCINPPPEQSFLVFKRVMVTLLQTLNIVECSRTRVNAERVSVFVVGMLYVAVQGVTAHGVVILHARPELQEILPLQSMLYEFFGLHAKLITENENMLKRYVNACTEREFEVLVNNLQHAQTPDAGYTTAGSAHSPPSCQ